MIALKKKEGNMRASRLGKSELPTFDPIDCLARCMDGIWSRKRVNDSSTASDSDSSRLATVREMDGDNHNICSTVSRPDGGEERYCGPLVEDNIAWSIGEHWHRISRAGHLAPLPDWTGRFPSLSDRKNPFGTRSFICRAILDSNPCFQPGQNGYVWNAYHLYLRPYNSGGLNMLHRISGIPKRISSLRRKRKSGTRT